MHNPVAPKADFVRAAVLESWTAVEYARGSEDRYKQQVAKAEQERQQRRKRVEPEVKHPVQSRLLRTIRKPAVAAPASSRDTLPEETRRPDKKTADILIVKKHGPL